MADHRSVGMGTGGDFMNLGEVGNGVDRILYVCDVTLEVNVPEITLEVEVD